MLNSLRDLLHLLRTTDRVTLLQLFHSRDAPAAIQFLKYAICGVGAVLIHVGVYLALLYIVWPELDAPKLDAWTRAKATFGPTAIAFLFSNAFVYWVNMKWVFTPGRHAPLVEFLLFTAVNLPGALTGTLGQAALVYFWHWPGWAAMAGFILPNVLINYLCRKFFIFQK